MLVAVGRAPYTEGLGLDSIGLELDERGRIPVNEHFATSIAGIYAIGDVIRGPMLAHKAEDEGIACVEHIATGYGHVNYDAIPRRIHESGSRECGQERRKSCASKASSTRKASSVFGQRTRSRARRHGGSRKNSDAKTDRILGARVRRASRRLDRQATAAIEFSATSEDLARTCHAHPTLAEIMREAAFAVAGRAIHI